MFNEVGHSQFLGNCLYLRIFASFLKISRSGSLLDSSQFCRVIDKKCRVAFSELSEFHRFFGKGERKKVLEKFPERVLEKVSGNLGSLKTSVKYDIT